MDYWGIFNLGRMYGLWEARVVLRGVMVGRTSHLKKPAEAGGAQLHTKIHRAGARRGKGQGPHPRRVRATAGRSPTEPPQGPPTPRGAKPPAPAQAGGREAPRRGAAPGATEGPGDEGGKGGKERDKR